MTPKEWKESKDAEKFRREISTISERMLTELFNRLSTTAHTDKFCDHDRMVAGCKMDIIESVIEYRHNQQVPGC
jgi:hypothetical protein